ncbi:MAG: DNA-3-methyladenine glycosylase [bacterium]|nr:DNA-3-methyladenine glycosylase [bacterium]
MPKKSIQNKAKKPMRTPLNASFFDRPTPIVARELLGKVLVRRYKGKVYRHRVTEVEIYDGFRDKASHASRGETKRNAPMFGSAGYWYVYFTYGMHWMLNVVTRERGYPAAILIRGVEDINGPARLTKRLHIDGSLSGKPATKKSGLWVEDDGNHSSHKATKDDFRSKPRPKIKKGPRVGVNYAGPHWSKRHWRLWI